MALAIVTGGSGFIGSHVVDALRAENHEVIVLDSAEPHRSDVRWVKGSVLNLDALLELTKGAQYLFHLAAVSNVNVAYTDPVNAVKLNIDGTVNCLEAARQNSLERFIFASTVWTYNYAQGNEQDETALFGLSAGSHIYTSTKVASEFLINDYWNLYGLPYTILRYGIPYGPRMRKELALPIFMRKAMNNEDIVIDGDGSAVRNFIYVEDLAQAHVEALALPGMNEVFNLDGKEIVTIGSLAESAIKLFPGTKSKVMYGTKRAGDYVGKDISNEKARKLLLWEPTTPFEAGLKKTHDWFISTQGK